MALCVATPLTGCVGNDGGSKSAETSERDEPTRADAEIDAKTDAKIDAKTDAKTDPKTDSGAVATPCGARLALVMVDAPPTGDEWKQGLSYLPVEIAASDDEFDEVPNIAPPALDRTRWAAAKSGKRYQLHHDDAGRVTEARGPVTLHGEGTAFEHYEYIYECDEDDQTIASSANAIRKALESSDFETLADHLSAEVYIGAADTFEEQTNGDTLSAAQVIAVLEAFPDATRGAAELVAEGCGVDADHEGYICPRERAREESLEGLSYITFGSRVRTLDGLVLSELDEVSRAQIDAVAKPNPTDYDGYADLAGALQRWVATQSPAKGLPSVFAKAGPDVTVVRRDANCSGRKCVQRSRERLADLQLWLREIDEQPGWDAGALVGCKEECCKFEDYAVAAAREGGMVPHELLELRRVCFTPYGEAHAGTLQELELIMH